MIFVINPYKYCGFIKCITDDTSRSNKNYKGVVLNGKNKRT